MTLSIKLSTVNDRLKLSDFYNVKGPNYLGLLR